MKVEISKIINGGIVEELIKKRVDVKYKSLLSIYVDRLEGDSSCWIYVTIDNQVVLRIEAEMTHNSGLLVTASDI